MNPISFLYPVIGFLVCPLAFGVINRTKAFFAGRAGQPVLQPYYDLIKLLKKGAVYSRTTTWLFRAGPMVGLAAVIMTMTVVPFGNSQALISFPGDLILFAALLGVMRFFYVIAAWDTGSSFEGMGASREVQFSALAEPVLFLGLAALAQETKSISLSTIYSVISIDSWMTHGLALVLIVVVMLAVFLAENARIPVDDPNTHLELTMIHEVMVLDHGGPDLAFIMYTAMLKLWVLGSLLIGILFAFHTGKEWLDLIVYLSGMLLLAITVGIIESSMARLRLLRVPQLLVGAGAFAVLSLVLVLVLR